MKKDAKDATTLLTQLSKALADTVEAVGSSVVRVEARRRGHASGVVWSEDGFIVTANHCVQRDQSLRAGLFNGDTIALELVGRDPSTDLAVLSASEGTWQPPVWAGGDDLRVGHLVLSVGRHDTHAQASLGIASKLEDTWRTHGGAQVETYLQTDIAIYPGFSGSALVNGAGHVIGINTSGLLRGLSMALPLATVRRIAGILIAHGSIRRGYLGIGAHPVPLPPSLGETLHQRSGLLVMTVESESPASDAGLLVGDLLVALANEPIRHIDDMLFALSGDAVGTELPLRFIRGGQLQTVAVTVKQRP